MLLLSRKIEWLCLEDQMFRPVWDFDIEVEAVRKRTEISIKTLLLLAERARQALHFYS